MFNNIKANMKTFAGIAIAIIIVVACVIFAWNRIQHAEEEAQKAKVLTQEQAVSAETLKNELNISKQNAEMLAKQIVAAQSGKLQPTITFVQQAPTVEKAAEAVAERINNNDVTLPKGATEKTDRTVVTPQEVTNKDGTKDWQVGVYKYNSYRNWEWSAGIGVHDGETYVPIGLQRNYSKDAAIEAEVHVDKEMSVSGGEIKYVRKTDKLFFLF